MNSQPDLPRRISLVAETTRSLREGILKSQWQDFLPGERVLCSQFQISRPTLRASLKELEQEGRIATSRGKRRQIIKHPTHSFSTTGKGTIAAISPRPLTAMAPSAVIMVDELRTNLARAGFQLNLIADPSCFSERPNRALKALTARTPASAWLVFGSREPMQKWFLKHQIPCLIAGSCAPGIALPSVDIDYRATCRHAGGILRSKGHRNITLVLPRGSTGGEADSETGLREAVERDNESELRVICHDGTAENLCALLERELQRKNPPTAFAIARAVHTLTAMTFLMRRGIRIPQDIAIISRDDETFLEHITPSPNRYATKPAQFTRRISLAARRLAETGTLPPKSIRIMPEYIPGETI